MADDVTLQNSQFATPPLGTVVATDNIGGRNFQRVKVTWGADGTATDAAAGAGLPVAQDGAWAVAATQSGAWAVTITSGSITLPTGAATAAKQPALGTAGTASSDVITIQGVASMTPILATLSAETTKVIGTVNQGGAWTVAATQSGTWNLGTVTTVSAVTAISNALPAGTNTIGKTYAAFQTTKALTNANVSVSTSGENTLVAGTAAQTIRAFIGSFTAASAVTLTFKDAASGTTLATIPLVANGNFSFDTTASGEPHWVTASAGALILSLSSAVSVTGYVQYIKS